MAYTPVIGTLGYVLSADGRRVLLVHRTRQGDLHAGKWNGLGGKLEAGEDVYSCLCRELREEAGIEVTSARLRGTISWPGFGAPTHPGHPGPDEEPTAASAGVGERVLTTGAPAADGTDPGSPLPSAPDEDWFGFVFVVDGWTGTVPERNDDGPLVWHDLDALADLPMWEGDRHWLPLVFGEGPMFHGVMPYVDGRPASWSYVQP